MQLDYSGIIINLLSSIIEKLIGLGGDALKNKLTIAKLLDKAKMLSLKDTFESIYIHAVIKTIENNTETPWIRIFSLPEFYETFKSDQVNTIAKGKWIETVNEIITYKSYLYNELIPILNSRPTHTEILEQISNIKSTYNEMKAFAMNPSILSIYNAEKSQSLEIEGLKNKVSSIERTVLELNDENKRKSFNFQTKEYLKNLIEYFNTNFLDKDYYIKVKGKVENKYLSDKDKLEIKEEEEILSLENSLVENQEGVVVENHEPLLIEAFQNETFTIFSSFDRYINNWLAAENKNLLILIGEYGTGKTTFLRYIAHQLASQIILSSQDLDIKNPENLIRYPIFLPLYNFEDKMNSFVVNNFNTNGIMDITFSRFKQKLKEGEFILLIDGFDEMGHTMGYDNKVNNFRKINELIQNIPNSKIILTTRNEYFQSESEMEEIFELSQHDNYSIAYTCYFELPQIKQYLEKRIPKDTRFYLQLINNTYDLNDLAKRPVLLDFIVKYLPRLIEKKKKQQKNLGNLNSITASELYEFAIKAESKRKITVESKFKPHFRKIDRLKILEQLALWLFHNGELLVFQLEEIAYQTRIRGYLEEAIGKKLLESEYENLLNRFLSYSFLIREGNYKFRISHKSFRDYLIAKSIATELNNKNNSNFGRTQFTDAIMTFILEQIHDIKSIIDLAKQGNEEREFNKWRGSNAIRILILKSKDSLEGLNFSNIKLSHIDFKDINLSKTNFEGSHLLNCKLNQTFINANLKDTNCKESIIDAKNSNISSIANLKNLTHLKEINIENTNISSLKALMEIKGLKKVTALNTNVSDFMSFQRKAKNENIDFFFDTQKTRIKENEKIKALMKHQPKTIAYLVARFNIPKEDANNLFFAVITKVLTSKFISLNGIDLNYLLRTTSREYLNRRKRDSRIIDSSYEDLDKISTQVVENIGELNLLKEDIDYLLNTLLNKKQKEVLELYILGYSYDEIATQISFKRAAVSQLLYRARTKLKLHYDKFFT